MTASFKQWQSVQEAISAGDWLKAMQVAGIHLDKAVDQQLKGAVVPAQTEAEKKLAAMEAELKQLKEKTEQRSSQDSEQRIAQAVETVHTYVTKEAKDFPFLSRNKEWTKEAYLAANEAYDKLVAKGEQLTIDQKNRLVRSALEIKEKHHAEQAKLYGATNNDQGTAGKPADSSSQPTVTSQKTTTPTTFTGSMRGGTVQAGAAQKLSFDQLRTRNRQRRITQGN